MLDIEFDDDSPDYIWDIHENLVEHSKNIETSWASTYFFAGLTTDASLCLGLTTICESL
jgi:hypothetical protein